MSITILGVDPGTNNTGYGIITAKGKEFQILTCGVIQLGNTDLDLLGKYKRIFDRMISLMLEFRPEVLAIESPFYGKNIQSTLKLGKAQGTVIAAALANDIPIYEYAPRKVKKSVVGLGNASKEQVAGMLMRIFPTLEQEGNYLLDMTDALAVAVCHAYQYVPQNEATGRKKYSSWSSFVQENPDRTK